MSDAYFLYHSIGMYPGKAEDIAAAMADFAAVWGRPDDGQWADVLTKRARFIERWRAILNAAPHTVTSFESVTQAFHSFAASLPADRLRGRTVLVAADCFPSNHFLLQGMAKAYDFTLKTVPLRQGAAWVEDEDFLDAWTPDVGLALLTWISSTSSHRIDLARMVAQGRRMGSLIGVDITQGAGLIPFDVMQPEVDFAISTSLKWMCGTPGAGVLYVAPGLIGQCEPELRGWFSQANPFNWDITRFDFAPGIERFDSGTPGCMAALASLPALDWHAGQDHAALLAHNRALTAEVFLMADDLGLSVATPRPEVERGGSVMIRLPETHLSTKIVAGLRSAGVTTDARGQILRISPGTLSNRSGVDRLGRELGQLLRE